MSDDEKRIAAQVLRMASEHFGNHGCNDYEIERTPANCRVVRRMIAESDYPNDDIHLTDEGKILVSDWMIMDYCAKLLEGEVESDEL